MDPRITSSASEAAPDHGRPMDEEETAAAASSIRLLEARIASLEAECRRLKLSERHFRTLIENASDLIAVLDRKGAIEYCSPACERVLDYSLAELSGKSMHEFLHPDDRERALRSVGMFLQSEGAAIHREFRLKRRDGRWQHFEGTAVNLLSDPGVRGIVVNAHDITERVRMETFFKSSLVEKETLLKEIHHRVKNNLQLISSMLGLQAHQIEDPAVSKVFGDSKDRIRSMALIHEQLYQSKNLSDINLADYLATLIRHLIGSHSAQSGNVRFTQAIGDFRLDIDRMIHLGLLVNEIVTNSLKHAFPQGRPGEISIAACEDEARDAIEIVIRDTGIGMPQEAGGIAGAHTLGLQLVSMLTQQLGGTIALATGPAGTEYTITLPRLHQA